MSMNKCQHCGNLYEGYNTICGCEKSVAAHTAEPCAHIELSTLKWWRELVDLNPQDLAPRIDEQIRRAQNL